MKTMNIIIMLLLAGIFACEKPMPIVPEPPEPPIVEDTVFEMLWATRMDFTKEIVGTDNTQHYKDWLLVGGDIDSPPTLMAFNKITGNKEWVYVHNGAVRYEIDISKVINNVYIGVCSDGIIGIDLDTREMLWEIDFKEKDMIRGYEILATEDKFYLGITIGLNTPSYTKHIMEIDIMTGAYTSVYSSPTDDTSPPVFWDDAETGQSLMLFNSYPNNYDPPEQTTQDMVAVDMDTKEVVWKVENFTENFASNVLHPPVIYKNTVITGGDRSIYAFDVRTGEQLWKYEFPDYCCGIWTKTNHLIHEDRLYVNNSQFDVTCLNPETGTLIWNNPQGGPNCTDNMVYYRDMLVFTSWGYGSVMVLDALTGKTIHREHRYDNSSYNNDVVYDPETDRFFTSTYKHAIGFKIHKP